MRKNKLPNVVTVAIFTTITIFAWIFFDVYRILTEKAELNIPVEILEPVNPVLNLQVLDYIKSTSYLEKAESIQILNQNVVETAPTPTPEPPAEVNESQETENTATESAVGI